MSGRSNVAVLRELADLLNARAPIAIDHFFTEHFRLDDAGAGIVLEGHPGAQRMIDDVYAAAPDFRYEMLDAISEGDRVAVRWRVTGTRAGKPFDVAMMALYRFESGRIAEDWGVWSPKPWRSM